MHRGEIVLSPNADPAFLLRIHNTLEDKTSRSSVWRKEIVTVLKRKYGKSLSGRHMTAGYADQMFLKLVAKLSSDQASKMAA